MSEHRDRPRVVIIGAGFAGLSAAQHLAAADVAVTIIDGNNFHTFQPLLYQVATAGLDADDVSFPVRRIFRERPGVEVILGWVSAIDLDARTVTVSDGRRFDYDFLVIAAGSVSTAYGVAGVEEHTFALKTVEDALDLRAHLLSGFERAAVEVGRVHVATADTAPARPAPARPASSQAHLNGGPDGLAVVIVGGGPTGVELAGGIRELVDKVMVREFPELHLEAMPITLVEAADRVLSPFHPKLSRRAAQTLRHRGVRVELGVGVDHVEADGVVLADGRRLPASTIVWAAGVTASPLARLLGVALGRGGRIVTADDLSLPEHPEVFAVGDIALSPGAPLPQVAQPAIQGGRHVAATIEARLAGRSGEVFRYHDKGSMATIGRNSAVAEFPNGWRFHGFPGWVMWLGLHLVELMGFRNRASVLVNWVWNYLTYDRGARLILPHDAGRPLPIERRVGTVNATSSQPQRNEE